MYKTTTSSIAIMSLILLLLSCVAGGEKREIEKVETEVIALHDEVMPLMGTLFKIRKQLQKRTEADPSNVQLVEATLNIKLAEEEMMDWMRSYDPSFEGIDDTETLDYLAKQKIAIEAVGIRMKEAMAIGEALIKAKTEPSGEPLGMRKKENEKGR